MKTTTSIVAVGFLLASAAFADISGDSEKIPGWVVAYETDAAGATVRGSLAQLIRVARSGGDIKILTAGSVEQTFICDSTIIFDASGTEHFGCNVNNRMSLVDESNIPVLRAAPYWTYYWFDTTGAWALARTSIYGLGNAGQSTGTSSFAKTWFARVR